MTPTKGTARAIGQRVYVEQPEDAPSVNICVCLADWITLDEARANAQRIAEIWNAANGSKS